MRANWLKMQATQQTKGYLEGNLILFIEVCSYCKVPLDIRPSRAYFLPFSRISDPVDEKVLLGPRIIKFRRPAVPLSVMTGNVKVKMFNTFLLHLNEKGLNLNSDLIEMP